uniref:SFRICE_005180 n=1 Tax=Spodoptera frugiperda TaxID=7108 RepID=A0A2H1WG73_SPOFR
MKLLLICALAVVCLAEPPVDNRYLPPQSGGGAPSAVYGAPGGGFQRQTDAVFRNRGSSRAGGRRPSTQYGAPHSGQGQFNTPSTQYGAPGQGSQPSSQYGAPSAQFGSQSGQFGSPSTQYGAPSAQYGAPSAQFGSPSSQYGAPSASAPSQQYGAPGFGGAGGHSQGGSFGGQSYRGQEQSRQYLPPGSGSGANGYGADDGSNGEPANYNFEYMVKDDESGNDFGHRESRQGDRAEGLYYVLLPDGRKQTVQYEADQDGYKPKISYEDTGLGQGGYDRNSQSGYSGNGNGYQGQGGY